MHDAEILDTFRARIRHETVRRVVKGRPEDKDVVACDGRVVREGQNVHATIGNRDTRRVCSFGVKRSEDDLCTIIDGLRCNGCRLFRCRARVVDAQVNLHALKVRNGHPRRIFEV